MAGKMTHRERTMAALKGEEVDRPPISMWRHFFGQETSGEGLAEAMLGFQRNFDWDFMKVNPRASYHAEGWGLKVRYENGRPSQVVEVPIREPDDWLKLEVLSPDQGVLAEQLHALELIAGGLAGQVPFLATVFTPFSIASRLARSEDHFLRDMRQHPEQVRQALDVVTETFTAFSKACLERGASGLFYATTTWATTQRMAEDEYRRFALPHDLKLLNALPPAEFHVLHVCQGHNMLSSLADYPVHAFNWDVWGTGNPALVEGRSLVRGRPVIGGLAHGSSLVQATPHQLVGVVRGIGAALGRKGWMLGTGCTFAPETPEANISAIRQAVEAS